MAALAFLSGIARDKLLLTASVLIVIAPHLLRLPVWIAALCITALGWRALHDAGRLRLPGRWLRMSIVAGAIGALAIDFHTILGQQAGSAMLVILLSLKLLEMHTRRDVAVVVYLAFFVIVVGFLFSQSIFTGVYMLLAVIMLLVTLIAHQHRQPVSLAAASFKRDTRHALTLIGQALPVAVLLFFVFPRIPGPLWGLPQDALSAQTGLSDDMQPGRISRLMDSDEVAFRVSFADAPPPVAQRYWRGPVLWRFDGQTWSAGERILEPRGRFELIRNNEPVAYTVTLEPHNRHWLFALELPAGVPQQARLSSEYQLIARERVKEITRYALRSYTDYRLDPDTRPDLQRYTAVPEETAPRTRQLVARLRGEAGADASYVNRVLEYFGQQPFYYSREAPLLFDDPVDEFLFETRVGFCEHYASAFTAMMRLGGIPARVVTGYQGGEMNPLSDYMIVRQSDAHAWSEVWLAGQGWVRIDPTAVIPPGRIRLSADRVQRQPQTRAQVISEQGWLIQSVRQAGYAWDALNNSWNQWIIGYDRSRQGSLFEALGLPQITWRGLSTILGIGVGLAMLILAASLLRRTRVNPDSATRLYARGLRRLARRGFAKQPHETPLQFYRRVHAQAPQLSPWLQRLTELYQLLRYAANDAPQHRQRLQQLRAQLRAFPRAGQ